MSPTRTLAARRTLAVLVALAVAAPARAQFFTPPPASLLIDTSIRSAAMGGASAAVMWGEPGVWANPATLAGVHGVGWLTGHTHVLPGVEDDVVFNSQRLLIGGGGLGVSLMGQPISGLGKAQLEYPVVLSPIVGASGDKVYDLSRGWAVGASPLRLIEDLSRLAGARPRSLTTYGDVTFGYAGKKSRVEGGSPVFSFDEASTYDWGVGGRLALARWWGADAPFRLDLSAAYSQVNVLESGSDPAASTVQTDRTGFALRLSPAPPSTRADSPPSLPWWRPGDIPSLAIGLAYDHDEQHYEPFGSDHSGIDHYGFEANVFRLLALRVGYLDDPVGEIAGWSYGGGVTVPIGPWGSAGYQLASVPMPDGVDRQFRQGWSLWLDPTRLWSDAR